MAAVEAIPIPRDVLTYRILSPVKAWCSHGRQLSEGGHDPRKAL